MTKLQFPFSTEGRNFYPITLSRSVLDLKVGILTLREKWDRLSMKQGVEISYSKNELKALNDSEHIWIPTSITNLSIISQVAHEDNGCIQISRLWDIFPILGKLLYDDINWIGNEISLMPIPDHVQQFGKHPLFLHKNSTVEPCTINTREGPVLIDSGATIMQGAQLRGPVYIGKNAVVKMGATLYGGCCIGDNCIIGGEVKNSVFQANSNKSHHGYIGDSYIGEFCNLGAGTSCSNLKNTTGKIKAWNMYSEQFEWATEKLGIIMGDHVRTAINTSFNSGAVIGSYSNIFDVNGLSPKFIPPFSWGGISSERYTLENLIKDVYRWEKMKNLQPSDEAIHNIKNLYAKLQ
jgi:UDP-N-acetylglucosamine diphosphorylase/glucosamine-1-phosphate N-acetyltransferase